MLRIKWKWTELLHILNTIIVMSIISMISLIIEIFSTVLVIGRWISIRFSSILFSSKHAFWFSKKVIPKLIFLYWVKILLFALWVSIHQYTISLFSPKTNKQSCSGWRCCFWVFLSNFVFSFFSVDIHMSPHAAFGVRVMYTFSSMLLLNQTVVHHYHDEKK